MDNKNEKKFQKFTTLYMSLGMCIGMVIGAAKDKRLSENMMKISRIEDDGATSDKIIYAVDQEGNEKVYKVTEKMMKQEKFSVEDRVAEETNHVLVSLESK